MKIKQWVAHLLPLVKKVLEADKTEDKNTNDYEVFCEEYTKLVNECGVVYAQKMKAIEERDLKRKSYRHNHVDNSDIAQALHSSSEKIRGVNHAIKIELGIETLPFPMSDASLIMSSVSKMSQQIMNNELDLEEGCVHYDTFDNILRKALLRDDPVINAMMSVANDVLKNKKTNQYLDAVVQFEEVMKKALGENNQNMANAINSIRKNKETMKMVDIIRRGI